MQTASAQDLLTGAISGPGLIFWSVWGESESQRKRKKAKALLQTLTRQSRWEESKELIILILIILKKRVWVEYEYYEFEFVNCKDFSAKEKRLWVWGRQMETRLALRCYKPLSQNHFGGLRCPKMSQMLCSYAAVVWGGKRWRCSAKPIQGASWRHQVALSHQFEAALSLDREGHRQVALCCVVIPLIDSYWSY